MSYHKLNSSYFSLASVFSGVAYMTFIPLKYALARASSAISVLPLAVGAVTSIFLNSRTPRLRASACGGVKYLMPLLLRTLITSLGRLKFSIGSSSEGILLNLTASSLKGMFRLLIS